MVNVSFTPALHLIEGKETQALWIDSKGGIVRLLARTSGLITIKMALGDAAKGDTLGAQPYE